jgi:hypothetical protein
MTKAFSFTLLGIVLICTLAFGQQARLTATVTDLITRAPMSGAYVSLISVRDTSVKHFTMTDKDGKASVTVKLPDNLTTWTMRGVGVTGDTRVGEGLADLVSTKPLLIRMRRDYQDLLHRALFNET